MSQKEREERKKEHDREYSRKYKLAHREQVLQKDRRGNAVRYSKNRDAIQEKHRLFKANHPEVIRAKDMARYIPLKERCELCGNKATCRHHPDYSKPLEVLHLCGSCHAKIHKGSVA